MRLSNVAASALLLAVTAIADATKPAYTLEEVKAQLDSYADKNSADSDNVARSWGHQGGQGDGHDHKQSGCKLACGFLKFTRPDTLSYPGSSEYHLEESGYWSQQQALTEPTCRFTPESAIDVSLAILTFRLTRCEFAVKSGGHAAFAGASNIEDGVTIDLGRLDEVTVAEDRKQARVGAGNVWYDVYTKLQPMGLTAIGGRVSAIGVGGLTLGGGVSFFSSRHGWACDNVNTYEVVFADGSIHEISYGGDHDDLYYALRGGGNNFGIVTRFDLATYPQGKLWAGAQTFVYSPETAAAINDAFYWLGENAADDPDAQVITAYAYAQAQGLYVIASDLQYARPEPYPAILKNFTDVPGAIRDTLRVCELTNLTQEFNATNPGGFRQTYWTYTVKNSASLMSDMVSIYIEEVEKIKDAPGLVPSAVFQPLTTEETKHFSKNGGNAVGLAGQGPLNLVNIDFSWSDESDDERVIGAAKAVVDRCVALAKERGLDHPYLYQNYAAASQDVFPSYGEDNLAKLRAVSDKYDPHKVWQELQPGYFKLGGY